MKRWLSLFVLTPLLVSCGTPAPTATLSRSTTVLPTETPTTTFEPTPTETLDPNAPQGISGGDDKGSYIEVDGVKYRQIELVDPKTAEKTKIWAGSLDVGEKPVPLLEDNLQLLLFQILIDSKTLNADHVPTIKHSSFSDVKNVLRFHAGFSRFFMDSRGVTRENANTSIISNARFKFTTTAGEFEWQATTESLMDKQRVNTIIFRNFDSLKEGDKGVIKYPDLLNAKNYFLVKPYVVDGQLVGEVASKISFDQLTNKELSLAILIVPIPILTGDDLVHNLYLDRMLGFINLAVQPTYPIFEFIPRP
jgi:hypothetical protein